MTKWEYCSLWFFPASRKYTLRIELPKFSRASEFEFADGTEPSQIIAKLGVEGWEMITFYFFNQSDDDKRATELYYFKRPLEP